MDGAVGRPGHRLWDLRIGAVIGAAMFEELAFRGLLFAGLRRRFRFGQAALISSALFAFAHGYEPGHQLAILWVGFVLAYTFERTRSLWPCVLAHAGYNLIQVEGLALFT
ncbi:MAG: lysostaphin resistance A-like protein [Planctomycetota bacterium]